MSAVIEGCKHVDQREIVETPDDIAREFRHLVNCDPYKDMLFVEINNQVIGFSRVAWRKEIDNILVYTHYGYLLPKWRRKGIGCAILHYNQKRLREIAAEHTEDLPRYFSSFAADTEIGTTAMLCNEGYLPIRHFYKMVRPDLENIPKAPLPSGLEVRPAVSDHFQAICDASNEAFRDHWGFSENMKLTVEKLVDDPTFNPSLWRVAWDGDQVAGMVLSYIDDKENAEYNLKRGWTEDICVRLPWRKQGLASALIVQSLIALKERGMEEAALGVDTDNRTGALGLYERLGYRSQKRFTVYRKPFEL